MLFSGKLLKGLGSSDGLSYFLYVWIDVGLKKHCGWFLNFLVTPLYKVQTPVSHVSHVSISFFSLAGNI
jgi:hypothetical protein